MVNFYYDHLIQELEWLETQDNISEFQKRIISKAADAIVNMEKIFRDMVETAEPEEVQHAKTGHWIPLNKDGDSGNARRCSNCSAVFWYSFRYCPECGSEMCEEVKYG